MSAAGPARRSGRVRSTRRRWSIDLDAMERNLARDGGVRARRTACACARTRRCTRARRIARCRSRPARSASACRRRARPRRSRRPAIADIYIRNEVVDPAKLARVAALAARVRLAIAVDSRARHRAARRGAGRQRRDDRRVRRGRRRPGPLRRRAGGGRARWRSRSSRTRRPRGLRFAGLQAYHGAAQHLRSAAERQAAIAARGVARARRAGEHRRAGIACPLVTGAGTGTFALEAASGVWGELQAGSYLFMDRDYADNEAAPGAPRFEHALFVKSQVISRGAAHAVIDAGHKSHAIDSGLPRVWQRELDVRQRRRRARHPAARAGRLAAGLPALGETVWLVPGHCDPTVNLHDRYVVRARRPRRRRRRGDVADRGARLRQLKRARANMTGAQIIVLATPVFLGLIGIELAIGRARGRNGYRLNDALVEHRPRRDEPDRRRLHGAADARHLRLRCTSASRSGSSGELAVDLARRPRRLRLLYYWHHRAGHRVALFWAAHVVHHQSEDYNLSTALRQTSSGWLVGWVFYLPMAVAGFPPLVFARRRADRPALPVLGPHRAGRPARLVRPLVLRAEQPPRPPRRERPYLDRNYGGVLIVWDRLFGSYAEEDRPSRASTARARRCGAGTRCGRTCRSTPSSRATAWRAARWADKLRVWLKPPGWRPADVAARWPKPPFAVDAFERYDPPASRAPSGDRARPLRRLARRDDAVPLACACPRLAGAERRSRSRSSLRCGPSAG